MGVYYQPTSWRKSGYAILYKRSVDRRPFRLWHNSFIEKHADGIMWFLVRTASTYVPEALALPCSGRRKKYRTGRLSICFRFFSFGYPSQPSYPAVDASIISVAQSSAALPHFTNGKNQNLTAPAIYSQTLDREILPNLHCQINKTSLSYNSPPLWRTPPQALFHVLSTLRSNYTA